MSDRRILAQRAPLLWILLPWVTGLALGHMGMAGISHVACLAVAWVTLLWALGVEHRVGWALLLGSGVVALGAVRYDLARQRLPEWEGRPAREARLVIEVTRRFAAGDDPRKVSGLGVVTSTDPHLRSLVGQRIYFSARLPRNEARPVRSAAVEVRGQLEVLPRNPAPATFEGFLAGAGVNFKLGRARIVRTQQPATMYWRWCDRMQTRMSDALGWGVEAHPEWVGILRAMVLGQQSELSEAQSDGFAQSGTLHLFSISGLHVTVIALALGGLLSLCRFPLAASVVLVLGLLWLYVDITGRVPSAVRAFFMIFLFKVAKVIRAPSNPVSALVVSALVVLVVEPMQLFSASFQMSYGIVAALLLLGLPLANVWEEKSRLFRSLPVVSWKPVHHLLDYTRRSLLSAGAIGVATLPVSAVAGVLYFGLFTPGALLANLVVIPAASLALLGGFGSVVATFIGEPMLALLFNRSAVLMLGLIEQVTVWFVTLPGVFLRVQFRAPWLGFLTLTLLIGLLLAGFQCGWSSRIGGFWMPFVVTLVALIFLVTFAPTPV